MAASRAVLRAVSCAASLLNGGGGASHQFAAASFRIGGARGIHGSAAATFWAGSFAQSATLRPVLRREWMGGPGLVLGGHARAFASLPPHIKLEMPSLSPTMNQVCFENAWI